MLKPLINATICSFRSWADLWALLQLIIFSLHIVHLKVLHLKIRVWLCVKHIVAHSYTHTQRQTVGPCTEKGNAHIYYQMTGLWILRLAWGSREEDQNRPTQSCKIFQQSHIDSALTDQGYWLKVNLHEQCNIVLCHIGTSFPFSQTPFMNYITVAIWCQVMVHTLLSVYFGTWVLCCVLKTETKSQRGVAGYSDTLLWIRAPQPVTIHHLLLFPLPVVLSSAPLPQPRCTVVTPIMAV